MKNGKKAIIVGATGLVGGHLLRLLIEDPDFDEVVVFGRRNTGGDHSKVKQVVTDFTNTKFLQEHVHGDVLFCCLGTTINKAGSKKAFEWVDMEIPTILAQVSNENKVGAFVMVTAIGANPNSMNFYNSTKGKAEAAVKEKNIPKTIICRPAMLMGKRDEFRLMEEVAKLVIKAIDWSFVRSLKKFRGIEGKQVARAMIHYFKTLDKGYFIIRSDQLQKFSSRW